MCLAFNSSIEESSCAMSEETPYAVLIVDDTLTDLELTLPFLTYLGVHVISASNRGQILKQIRATRIRSVLF